MKFAIDLVTKASHIKSVSLHDGMPLLVTFCEEIIQFQVEFEFKAESHVSRYLRETFDDSITGDDLVFYCK